MGGFLQAVVFGYGGLRLQKDALTVNLTLPQNTTQLTLTSVDYLSNSLNISGNATTLSVEVLEQGLHAADLEMTVGKDVFNLHIGEYFGVVQRFLAILGCSR